MTSTQSAFRDGSEFAPQLTKSDGNSDLIYYASNKFVANMILRERLLKGIADELSMKKNFKFEVRRVERFSEGRGSRHGQHRKRKRVCGLRQNRSATFPKRPVPDSSARPRSSCRI